jgi:hypothetical protein
MSVLSKLQDKQYQKMTESRHNKIRCPVPLIDVHVTIYGFANMVERAIGIHSSK